MTPYWIFILILLSFSLPISIFAEPVDVEIDWIIEGQVPIAKSVPSSEFDVENNSIIEKQINRSFTSQNKISNDVADDFITGSGYMLGSNEITIDSEEGQKLNQLLIEQRQINEDNFFHMIKYLDRYSDGYVELAEALIDPVRQQNYQQEGLGRDFNVNSNLEYFLIERGYDFR